VHQQQTEIDITPGRNIHEEEKVPRGVDHRRKKSLLKRANSETELGMLEADHNADKVKRKYPALKTDEDDLNFDEEDMQ
jgi:hypothetical protein